MFYCALSNSSIKHVGLFSIYVLVPMNMFYCTLSNSSIFPLLQEQPDVLSNDIPYFTNILPLQVLTSQIQTYYPYRNLLHKYNSLPLQVPTLQIQTYLPCRYLLHKYKHTTPTLRK